MGLDFATLSWYQQAAILREMCGKGELTASRNYARASTFFKSVRAKSGNTPILDCPTLKDLSLSSVPKRRYFASFCAL